ncbi:MAG: toll/interleukin-1 receptor domain-containing protein [Deltaproteobacteria bacterium]|nr:toll/interleukin-1 receptor domain-containing protein [Deltaproteobacteria bacterium]
MTYRMFISYSQSDWIVVGPIRDRLTELGAEVFLDRDALHYGERFRDRILPEVERADELVALLTPTALRRAWLFAEMGVALRCDVRIVGIMYGGTTLDMLQELGVLSLVGDIHHVVDSQHIDDYYGQVQQRVTAADS